MVCTSAGTNHLWSILLIVILALASTSCSFLKREARLGRQVERVVRRSPVFQQALCGFSLFDPSTGNTLANVLSDRYFIPASNTKVFTLAASLAILGDSIPGFEISEYGQQTRFSGTADPTCLHPDFQAWQPAYKTLANASARGLDLYYQPQPFTTPPYGAGWSWDDMHAPYQARRTEMPLYGNCIEISTNGLDSLAVFPPYFADSVVFRQVRDSLGIIGTNGANSWQLEPNVRLVREWSPLQQIQVPALWSDTLHTTVQTLPPGGQGTKPDFRLIYSAPIDTVLRYMMWQSDNFFAEQMLLVCSKLKFHRFEEEPVIQWVLDSVLHLSQRPKWKDGSGLSRYNLATPGSMVEVLHWLWQRQPQERLFSLFPAGGVSGTIESWYGSPKGKAPYVFAKTGSLSGVHCLSGYIRCRSGKVLIFSFMHNNFIGSNRPWKLEMQRILEMIRDRY